MSRKVIILFVLFFFLAGTLDISFSMEEKGRVIEINRDLQVIFVNRGKNYLNVDDIVEVYNSNVIVAHLKVIQVLEKVAALAGFRDEQLGARSTDIGKITVGDTFSKVSRREIERTVPKKKTFKAREEIFVYEEKPTKREVPKKGTVVYSETVSGDMKENYERLSKHLDKVIRTNEILTREKVEAMQEKEEYRRQAEELNKKFVALKGRLNNIESIVDRM